MRKLHSFLYTRNSAGISGKGKSHFRLHYCKPNKPFFCKHHHHQWNAKKSHEGRIQSTRILKNKKTFFFTPEWKRRCRKENNGTTFTLFVYTSLFSFRIYKRIYLNNSSSSTCLVFLSEFSWENEDVFLCEELAIR